LAPLCDEIDQRWKNRFGPEVIFALRTTLIDVVDHLNSGAAGSPPRETAELPLPALLSRLLLAFDHNFQRESKIPIGFCANSLRVLGKAAIPEREIPRLTGSSLETSGIGWQLKHFTVVERDPVARRGKVVRLNRRGLAAQADYTRLVQESRNNGSNVSVRKTFVNFGGSSSFSSRRAMKQGCYSQRECIRRPVCDAPVSRHLRSAGEK
jgi:hypothetical protein